MNLDRLYHRSLSVPLLKQRFDFPLVKVISETFLDKTVLQFMLKHLQILLEFSGIFQTSVLQVAIDSPSRKLLKCQMSQIILSCRDLFSVMQMVDTSETELLQITFTDLILISFIENEMQYLFSGTVTD